MINELPIRKPTRLPDYDYSEYGAYFVTVCTYERIEYFADNRCEKIALDVWESLPEHHDVRLDEFVIMPDHVHFIIWILKTRDGFDSTGDARVAPTTPTNDCRVEACLDRPHGPKPKSLSSIVGSFKSEITRRIRSELNIGFGWQRSFYDHAIRDENDLCALRGYIRNNPTALALGDE